MLPWLETEITPRVPHAGVRRFGFDRFDAGRNVRGLVEGQMMAMANHAADVTGEPIERIIATGGAATNRAHPAGDGERVRRRRLSPRRREFSGAWRRAARVSRRSPRAPASRCRGRRWSSGFTEPNPGHRVSPNPKHVAMYEELRRDYAILERLHKDRRAYLLTPNLKTVRD